MLTINWPDSFHLGESVALVNFVVCVRIMILVEGNVIESSTQAFPPSAVTVPLTYLIIIRVNVIPIFDRGAVCTKVCF